MLFRSQKLPVELYEGREVSFMTAKSQSLLESLQEKLCFVPLTTRSTAQYQRICFSDKFCPTLALTGNGGTLLCHGTEDEEWTKESFRLIEDCQEDLKKAEELLENDPARTLDVRRVNDLFVFTKSSAPKETLARMRQAIPSDKVRMYQNGVKVYVVPVILNKATALRRLKARLQPELTIAGGDSLFDIEMLVEADAAFAAPAIAEEVKRLRAVQEAKLSEQEAKSETQEAKHADREERLEFQEAKHADREERLRKYKLTAGKVYVPAEGELLSELMLGTVTQWV